MTYIHTPTSPTFSTPPLPPPMALVRERRLNLTLELPTQDSAPAASSADCGFRFSLPPLPPAPAAACSSAAGGGDACRLSDFEKLKVLGHGNGGTVYKVRHRRSSATYALKILHSAPSPSSRREIDIHRSVESSSVVKCYSTFSTSAGDPALLLEYMDSGSLNDLVRKAPLPEPALADICRQVLQGLSYLHSQKIVHRDIKPSNLLVNSAGQIKIADFGVSKLMRRSLDACVSYVGTCAYMSPERFDPETYGVNYDAYAADVWSLGLTVLELFLGRFPLVPEGERPDWAALMCAICFGEPPAMPEGASEELRDFVVRCLQKEAGKRWSVGQLMCHPFVAGRDQAESERVFRELLSDGPAESS